jgi:hypothetical protein
MDKPLDKKDFKNKDSAFVINDEGNATLCMIHQEDGQPYMFPIPDLTLIYFTQAQSNIKDIQVYKNELLTKSAIAKIQTESSTNEFYQFYGAAAAAIIFLSTALESFINQSIPENFIFRQANGQKKCIEEYDHEQIQRFLSTDSKIKNVMPSIYKKDFYKIQNKNTLNIDSLKRLRDEIIHTKIVKNEMHHGVIKKLLAFNYDGALQSVAVFMNFYNPNYIIECDCGLDF